MIRVVLLVPDRPTGWVDGRIAPFFHPCESEAHTALTAEGFRVETVYAEHFLRSGRAEAGTLGLMSGACGELTEKVTRKLTAAGGRMLILEGGPGNGGRRRAGQSRQITLTATGARLSPSRLPRHHRIQGLRKRLLASAGWALEPREGEEVAGRWGRSGPAVLLARHQGGATVWRTGLSLDRLSSSDLLRLLGEIVSLDGPLLQRRSPLPEGARAVVSLLHDVEDPILNDPRGIQSVRDGTVACLQAEARHGFRATYNLVGRFSREIPDLVRRIAAEGHELASHGGTHQVVADLADDALTDDVVRAEEEIRSITGARIQGFRSPRSRWSGPLLRVLGERGYSWNAEADDSPFPYSIPGAGNGGLVRMPVAVDDWDYVKRNASTGAVQKVWMKEVRSAMERRCWVAIGSHPSVLGARPERAAAFGTFLGWLAGQEVRVLTLGEGASWWRARMGGQETERARETGGDFV